MPVLEARAIGLDYKRGNEGAFDPRAGSAGLIGNAGGLDNMTMPDREWVRLRQPFMDTRGRAMVTIRDLNGGFTRNDSPDRTPRPLLRNYLVNDLRNQGYPIPNFVGNAQTLTKQAWQQLDRQVILAARQRLFAAQDLENSSSYGGFDALGHMTLEYQAMSDPGQAVVDMDARTDGRNDTPLFILRSLPLPITHSDFGFSSRELRVSRSGSKPLDSTMGEACGRRVAEMVEDTTIGNVTGVTYATQTTGAGTHTGTSTVYGYTNFPQRLTKTNFTAPSAGGWAPTTLISEINTALNQLRAQRFYGPWILYTSVDWDPYLDSDYYYALTSGAVAPTRTLRERVLAIKDITKVQRLDRLTSTFTLIFVQQSPEVAQMVNGMDITTIQWEEKGGLDLRFKVMCIKVPRLRSDYNSRTGILHGTTA